MDLKKKAPGREWSLLKNEKPVWKKWKEEQSANHYLQFPMSCVMMHHHGLVLASTIRKALVHAFTHIRDDDCHRYPWLQAMKDSSIYKRIVRNVIFLESCMQLFDRKILKFQTIHSSTRSEKARMENKGKNERYLSWLDSDMKLTLFSLLLSSNHHDGLTLFFYLFHLWEWRKQETTRSSRIESIVPMSLKMENYEVGQKYSLNINSIRGLFNIIHNDIGSITLLLLDISSVKVATPSFFFIHTRWLFVCNGVKSSYTSSKNCHYATMSSSTLLLLLRMQPAIFKIIIILQCVSQQIKRDT